MSAPDARRSRSQAASNSSRETTAWIAADPQEMAETVAGCQQGNRFAQHKLYQLAHQSVFRLMVRMVGQQDAADATQQAFLQVYRKIGQFAGKSHIGTWIYRVAVNEALQHLRRSKRSRPATLDQDPMDHAPNIRNTYDDQELLERALGLVDPGLRSAFLLREIEGLSYNEIAVALDIPEGTVGSRLNRARHELRRHLTELGWEG